MTVDRVLVTGATGFVGRHLTRSLVARGVEVVALVRPGSPRPVPDGVHAVPVPVRAEDLASVVRDASPQVCVHLATRFLARHRPDDVAEMLTTNVVFGARLAEALVAAGGAPIIDVGSVWQYVDGAAYRPANLYAASKQAFADLLVAYSLRQGLPVVRVILTDTYGPGDDRPRLVPLLLRAAASGEDLALSSGTQLIDIVHIDDVVAAFALLSDGLVDDVSPIVAATDGTTRFGVSSGRAITVRELAATVERVAGRTLAARWGEQPDREVEMREPWDPGPPVPGWSPRITLEDGLAALL